MNRTKQEKKSHNNNELYCTKHNSLIKIISFIIGCVIGGLLGSYQISAWGMPIGYDEIQTKEVSDPKEYCKVNQVDIPNDIKYVCEEYGEKYNICPEIGMALAWRESRCTDATNGKCIGYCQINTSVHKERIAKLGVKNIRSVDDNFLVAFDLLSELYGKYGDMSKTLDAYNGNKNNGKSEYAKDILTTAKALDEIGGD